MEKAFYIRKILFCFATEAHYVELAKPRAERRFYISERGVIGFANTLCLFIKVKHSESFGVCGIAEGNRIGVFYVL